jgi:predicted Zn finger-like uncharacterized protein
MAIVTLCPQCQTAFAIHADHYSAADSWVRCGRCAHVFEVDQHLYELDENKATSAAVEMPASKRTLDRLPKPAPLIHQWVWGSFAFFMALGICFQVLVFQRDQWRAQYPEFTPMLLGLCATLGCDLHWPEEPSQVSIATGGFKSLGDNQFIFSGSIKNQSDWPVATPLLELSLTDDVDAAVVRKVFTVNELGVNEVLRARRAQAFELQFTLDPALSGSVTGYRAFLFYP